LFGGSLSHRPPTVLPGPVLWWPSSPMNTSVRRRWFFGIFA